MDFLKNLKNKLPVVFCRRGALPALCYLLALAVWLVLGVYALAADGVATMQGKLAQQELSATDFALVDLENMGNAADAETGAQSITLQTRSGDPQMILEDVSAQTVRTLQLYCNYSTDPREMCLYYTTAMGQDYSQDRRVFPVVQADGSYLYTLPRGRLVALRLDPCSPDAEKPMDLQVKKIVLNRPMAAWHYFVPSWYQVFCLVLWPGLAAALLSWGYATYKTVQNAKNKK